MNIQTGPPSDNNVLEDTPSWLSVEIYSAKFQLGSTTVKYSSISQVIFADLGLLDCDSLSELDPESGFPSHQVHSLLGHYQVKVIFVYETTKSIDCLN